MFVAIAVPYWLKEASLKNLYWQILNCVDGKVSVLSKCHKYIEHVGQRGGPQHTPAMSRLRPVRSLLHRFTARFALTISSLAALCHMKTSALRPIESFQHLAGFQKTDVCANKPCRNRQTDRPTNRQNDSGYLCVGLKVCTTCNFQRHPLVGLLDSV